MLRVRILLAWLLMVMVPLQGFAAASMIFCGMNENHSHAAATPTAAVEAPVHHEMHDAAAQHGHSTHSHAGGKETGKQAGSVHGSVGKCSVCADCCSSVAIANLAQVMTFAPVPQADLAEPFVLIHARPSSVPDKPPRV